MYWGMYMGKVLLWDLVEGTSVGRNPLYHVNYTVIHTYKVHRFLAGLPSKSF